MCVLPQCGVVRGTYLALEHMKKTSGGHGGVIVNVASMAGDAATQITSPMFCMSYSVLHELYCVAY